MTPKPKPNMKKTIRGNRPGPITVQGINQDIKVVTYQSTSEASLEMCEDCAKKQTPKDLRGHEYCRAKTEISV